MFPLPPGSTIGILGGGQLGRMLALAAARLGLKTHIFSASSDDPASQVSTYQTSASFDDTQALTTFGESCDALTYEWESIPLLAVETASRTRPVFPNLNALETAQDRLLEKQFLSSLPNVTVAFFMSASGSIDTFKEAVRKVGFPCVVKTRRGGYDGKGQAVVKHIRDIDSVWKRLGQFDLIVEGFVTFSREVSIVCARGQDGDVKAFPLTENIHLNHILHTSTAPAQGDDGHPAQIAQAIVESLDYVGVIGVELFDTAEGWLVNEIAPRVHNSGHWTQDAGCTDQFEQHIRAVAGWPLGDATPAWPVEMTNLIGEDIRDWAKLAKSPGTHIHLYGKHDIRPARKMGHVNRRLT